MNIDAAHAYFSAQLEFESDPSDVYGAITNGSADFVFIDTRDKHSWDQGHAVGAVHLPKADMPTAVPRDYPTGTTFVVYCWGPGCNGATRAALILTSLGYAAKVMIGGFEYWAREGLPVEGAAGDLTQPADPLTAPVGHGSSGVSCDC